MSAMITLKNLWKSTHAADTLFQPNQLSDLPAPAIRYLRHAIAPGSALARAVRLQMHGEIKLKDWVPFEAEQVIHIDRGMIWKATARMAGIPIRGADRIVDGEGSMLWRVLGIVPVMKGSGPDITRSTAGRLQGEYVWLPSRLALDTVRWSSPKLGQADATLTVAGHTATVSLSVDEDGRILNLSLPRWGSPEGGSFGTHTFGAEFEAEQTYGGYTIPSKFRAGWYYGSDRFEPEGEFFRCTIDQAEYR